MGNEEAVFFQRVLTENDFILPYYLRNNWRGRTANDYDCTMGRHKEK